MFLITSLKRFHRGHFKVTVHMLEKRAYHRKMKNHLCTLPLMCSYNTGLLCPYTSFQDMCHRFLNRCCLHTINITRARSVDLFRSRLRPKYHRVRNLHPWTLREGRLKGICRQLILQSSRIKSIRRKTGQRRMNAVLHLQTDGADAQFY